MSLLELNGKKWPVLLVLGGFAGLLVMNWGLNATAVSFGNPPQGELVQKVVHRGDPRIDVSYDHITWYRPWPSTITQYYECMVRDTTGKPFLMRFDLQTRIVPIPNEPGPLPRKQRPVANQYDVPYPVPAACEPGPLHYGGYIKVATLWGWWNLSYDLPPKMDAEIQP